MSKRRLYMVVDTETATLPFASEIAGGDPEKKKKIAIARPLIYDIGWTITNRQGDILENKQFLIAETFAVPAVFNTAYYAEKRPRYLAMLENKETVLAPWDTVMEIFINDLHKVDAVGAFNAMFDFKKAIPFTELYIRKLYSPDYQKWEQIQKNLCRKIANEPYKKDSDKDFNPDAFTFRGETYPLFDLWGLATSHLLNNATYKTECLKHGLLTASGTYFKTSAETTYQYLCNKYDFIESHTALDDAIIETYILSRIAKRHAVSIGIKYFPFRDLGDTVDFVTRRKTPKMEECETVYNAISAYLDAKMESDTISNYCASLINKLHRLAEYTNTVCPY